MTPTEDLFSFVARNGRLWTNLEKVQIHDKSLTAIFFQVYLTKHTLLIVCIACCRSP